MAATPDRTDLILAEEIAFLFANNEETKKKIGGAINSALNNGARKHLGEIELAALDEATFLTQKGESATFTAATSSYALMDGRSISGSQLQINTGLANVPDARATFSRGKDNGSGNDAQGDVATGTERGPQSVSHLHSVGAPVIPVAAMGIGDMEIGPPRQTFGGDPRTVDNAPSDDRQSIQPATLTEANTGTSSEATGTNPGDGGRPNAIHLNFFMRIN